MSAALKPLWGRACGALSIFTATTLRAVCSIDVGRPVRGETTGSGVGSGLVVGVGDGRGVCVGLAVGVGWTGA